MLDGAGTGSIVKMLSSGGMENQEVHRSAVDGRNLLEVRVEVLVDSQIQIYSRYV